MSGHASAAAIRFARLSPSRCCAVALLLATTLGLSKDASAQVGMPTDQQAIKMISSGQAAGGGRSTGGSFLLEGTIGQTVAAPMSGGSFLIRSGFVAMCPDDLEVGDIDGDGSVGGSDLGILLLLYGPCPDPFSCPGDLDNNGEVDAGDIGLMLVLWH